MVSTIVNLSNVIARVSKSVMPLVVPKIMAYACKSCSSIASVSVVDNKITVKKCRCV